VAQVAHKDQAALVIYLGRKDLGVLLELKDLKAQVGLVMYPAHKAHKAPREPAHRVLKDLKAC
jgi:hypothetical protein